MEIWLKIEGWPYEVSSIGRVKSLSRLVPAKAGSKRKIRTRIINQSLDQSGYPRVSLSYNGVRKAFHVHILVCTAFHGPCPDGMECRHFPDNSPLNNNEDNLSWETHKVNLGDKEIHGTLLKGEKNPSSKLTENKVTLIRKESNYLSIKELATKYSIPISTVYWIVTRKTWKHL